MKKHNSLIGVIFTLLSLLPASAQAWEYFLSPPDFTPEVPLKWYEYDSNPATARVTVLVDSTGLSDILGGDPDNGVMATVSALHAWNSPTLDRLITAVPGSGLIVHPLDGQSTVHFTDPTLTCIGNCLALTFVTHYEITDPGIEMRSCNGRDYLPYYDVDIVTNPGSGWTSVAEGGACSFEYYIEAVMSHEAGHMIGLGHEYDPFSLSVSPLMYSALGYCDNKTLQQDDLTGRDVIYGCAGNSSNPSLPTSSFSSSATGLSASFSDQSTGGITSWLWSFGDGASSTEQNPTHTYASDGSYTVSLMVTNSEDTDTQTLNVSGGGSGGLSLSATGYKVKGKQTVDLTWSGGTALNVDIFRDGGIIATVPTTPGAYTYNSGVKGGGNTNTYKVCDEGSTSSCSNTVNVTF